MAISHGPNGTPIDGLSALTFPVGPLNFDADFRILEDEPGRVVMADVTSPYSQLSTIRIAQSSKPNVYAGTSIDPTAFLANRRGTDTILEVREVWSDPLDATGPKLMPVRCAVTLSLPTCDAITASDVQALIARAVALAFRQGEATATNGINDLLHGVVRKD
ncbi:coat protein [ssRNA phage SRR7976324_1]|uniref:Coat protein n=1 Tax=ssRNA phage SRR7976324_1 TaxID=2786694 RepID=A0A8S5L151_9VIRU|nr:coat protein [ssRNA phage SRR7976324_1]DAD51167.1 TPA_asm: coat protein [ssRNA phage SRR7976324_1]